MDQLAKIFQVRLRRDRSGPAGQLTKYLKLQLGELLQCTFTPLTHTESATNQHLCQKYKSTSHTASAYKASGT